MTVELASTFQAEPTINIHCDGCRNVTFYSGDTDEWHAGNAAAAVNWLIGVDRDLCPHCADLEDENGDLP